MLSLATSIAAFEDWSRAALQGLLVEADLDEKHAKMADNRFMFLRATCWRWAEGAPELCPELMGAQPVASVGDAHAGNFGLWRDADARLVWGINDYDEAARVPWPLDLVRLTVSFLAADEDLDAGDLAQAVLQGYRAGLEAPRAFILERDHLWLRDAFIASDEEREDFWRKLEAADEAVQIPPLLRGPLLEALPADVESVRITPRTAGAGSLGRPRFVAKAEHRGGPMAAEIKAWIPSCWKDAREDGLAGRMAAGPTRSPDPLQFYADRWTRRRLAPNSRKMDFEKVKPALRERLAAAMAADLAAVHVEEAGSSVTIQAELHDYERNWLARAARKVAEWTSDEQKQFKRSQ